MAVLGFAAGLPLLLVFTTLTYWLSEAGVARSSIGFFTWIGITYSIKWCWSPFVDRLPLPLLTRWLGQRRGWILAAQCLVIVGLLGMASSDPREQLLAVALWALLVAFGSATQDIAIDAWRIEAAPKAEQAAMSAVYVFGYRAAMLVSGAGALHLATALSWGQVYTLMAMLMGLGVLTVLLSPEPRVRRTPDLVLEARANDWLQRRAHLPGWLRGPLAWSLGAVVSPVLDFFKRYGAHALLLLVLVGCYRISDISMGAMAMPLYNELGFSKAQVANVSGVYGIAMTILGGMVGGVLVLRYGLLKMLFVGALLSAATNLLFAWLAASGAQLWLLVLTISGDNFCAGMAMAVLIAWLSSLTSPAYTATQYALFSSLMTLPGKLIGGFSGLVVDAVGYVLYFFYVAGIGLPAILLCLYLLLRERRALGRGAAAAGSSG